MNLKCPFSGGGGGFGGVGGGDGGAPDINGVLNVARQVLNALDGNQNADLRQRQSQRQRQRQRS